ncbi:carboxymuconolactone decarboxylase family protein [Arachidicoccus ginsenosidivorans]|jgi:AhpD family alkylhydroperoxidase|uniref:Carboxymuconolactone decarboxylase family protein n=1 Tax=Arachidicoccus ginsenosidivorans TaxID=496057 RepID=A0A5B8VJV8_9BACT|nr:carboxymuconolactone decarboxylase family protein [Arachidicoccus ginsenosidivorans]QEC71837.1 carboxymuconolactone decarboxylase family protein [Arachidicoccus ginsenosidivorans]
METTTTSRSTENNEQHNVAGTKRISLLNAGHKVLATLNHFGTHLMKADLPEQLLHLIYYRVSQINGCAFCLDMHSKDLLAGGENVQRLLTLDAWRETPFFSPQERAALAWAEAVTKLPNGEVPENVYQEAARHFSAAQLMDLTLGVAAINTYNRFNIAFPPEVGGYKPGMFAPRNAVDASN